jgi:O-antigen/teichoic acid export membrane protein
LSGPALTVVGRGISKFAIVIFLIIAARLLSKEEFAVYSYVLALTQVFAILGDPQVSLVAARDVSAGSQPAATGFWAALPVVTVTAAFSALGLFLFGLIDSFPGTTVPLLLLAALFIVFNRLVGLGTDMLRALGRFRVEAAIETGGTVLLVLVASVLTESGAGITAVLGVFAAVAVLCSVACLLFLRRDIGRPAHVPGRWRELLRSGLKLWISTGSSVIAVRAPLIILATSGSAAAVASLSVGLRFADAGYLLALTGGQALLPVIAALVATDVRRAVGLTRRTVLVAMAGGAAVAALIAPFGSTVAAAVFGSKYESAGPVLAVMMLALPFMGMYWISWYALLGLGRESDIAKVSVGAALASVVAGMAVIPGSDETGAAWVYVGSLAAMALATFATFELRVRQARAQPLQRVSG